MKTKLIITAKDGWGVRIETVIDTNGYGCRDDVARYRSKLASALFDSLRTFYSADKIRIAK